jgi:hypothetical protein
MLQPMPTDHVYYRLTELPTWDSPVAVMISIDTDGNGTANLKVASGQGGYHPGVLVVDKKIRLTKAQTQAFLRKVQEASFWDAPVRDDRRGCDGTELILEAHSAGRYHVVVRWTPVRGAFFELGQFILKDIASYDPTKVQTLRKLFVPRCREDVLADQNSRDEALSPDRKYRIRLTKDGTYKFRSAKASVELSPRETWGGVKWSPDSKSFFITKYPDPEVYEYFSGIYLIIEGKPHEAAPFNAAVQSFAKTYQCKESRAPNIFPIRWLGPSRLLVAIEVPSQEACGDDAGKYSGFSVNVANGSVERQYSPDEVWAQLTSCATERQASSHQ